MYTPRQTTFPNAHAMLDPITGIRVVIQPLQSSYFAGEPFTCTVTFTNTRSPIPAAQTRAASFSPGHKRAAHSVSSAPLARPPTSPGTPKAAQSFLQSQNRDIDVEVPMRRRGVIGKPAVAATAAFDKKRRSAARSLSVDITPQDLIKRLADPGSPTAFLLPQLEQTPPASPRVSSSLAREHANILPPSHPHTRKHSVVSDDLVPSSPCLTSPQMQSSPTPMTASPFQLSLDPITEHGNHISTPPNSVSASHFPSSSSLILPPPSPTPRGNRPGHTRRASLGLGLPLAGVQATHTRGKSAGGGPQPPHTALSTTFSISSDELLLYAYAQLTGTLTIDKEAVPTSIELDELRTALHQRVAMGGGSLDIASAGQRPRSSSNASLLSSFLGGRAANNVAPIDDEDDALPTLETQPSVLAVDLNLAAGESRTYSYILSLPPHLPPTFKGRALRFSYQLIVGTCRATSPVHAASQLHLSPPSLLPSPGLFDDRERRRSRIMRVPIRVYNHVAVGHGPIPYDLMWPVARRRAPALTGRVEEMAMQGSMNVAKQLKPAGTFTGLQTYAQRLMSDEDEWDLESAAGEVGEGGALSGCAEAVEINTRNPKRVSYDVSKDGEKVAVLTFVKSAYRLGETVLGVVELNGEHYRSKVLKLSTMLEAHESLPWTDTPIRRVHAEHHASLVSDMRRVAFALDIPSDASPAFKIVHDPGNAVGGLEWKVRMCLLVAIAAGGNGGSAKGKGREVEVRSLVRDGSAGEWGTSWQASESIIPMERLCTRTPQLLPQKSSSSWTSLFSALAGGTFHDAGSDSDSEDDGEWAEMRTEMVECTVPLQVYAGNTAFRALEVAFEV